MPLVVFASNWHYLCVELLLDLLQNKGGIVMRNTVSIFIFSIIIVFSSCQKKDSSDDPVLIESMDQLVVDENFNWTSGIKGKLEINFINRFNVSTEKEVINIIDEDANVIKRARIANGTVSFNIDLPLNAQYYVQFPVTGDEVLITSTGTMEIELGPTSTATSGLKSVAIENCTTCDNPIENAGGELPVINVNYTLKHENDVPGWETTASDNKIEIWTSGFQGVAAQEGQQFFELNANMVADLYQELCLEPGYTIMWSVWHRGRAGVDVAEVKIGETVATAVVQETMSDGNTAWGNYTGSYTVPEGQSTTFFVFTSVSSAGSPSVGNFLDNFEVECDYDGDGIPDDEDDDPGNEEVSFISYFPTSGKQVVAFEDLWPSTGDFDFNDLTMSNQVVINKDEDFDLLSADFKVSIDAIGASIHNGIGMMLYDSDGNSFSENIISSVEGDVTLDSENTNGLILTNDVFEAIDEYYQNNGSGPTKTPDTLRFTITFNSNAEEFIPELYIFRSADRSYEIHRSDFPTTAAADLSLFNTVDDDGHYKTSNGLPWGIEIILDGQYKSPREKVDMVLAYPQFQLWATSSGSENVTWYNSPVDANVLDILE